MARYQLRNNNNNNNTLNLVKFNLSDMYSLLQ